MIKRITACAWVAILGYSFPLLAQTPPVPTSEAAKKTPSVSKRSALSSRRLKNTAIALLNKRVEQVSWDEDTFETVIEWLRGEADGLVNIVPRWNALSVEDIGRDAPVTLKLRDVTVAQVLLEVLDQLSEDRLVAFRASGNMLKISTKADFGRNLYMRIYDATDILFRVPNNGEDAPTINLQQAGSGGGGGGGGGGGQSVFQGSGGGGSGGSSQGGEEEERETEERLDDLRTLIEETIAPDSWDSGKAGGLGRIRVFNNSLVVWNTIEVHEMIGGLFSQKP